MEKLADQRNTLRSTNLEILSRKVKELINDRHNQKYRDNTIISFYKPTPNSLKYADDNRQFTPRPRISDKPWGAHWGESISLGKNTTIHRWRSEKCYQSHKYVKTKWNRWTRKSTSFRPILLRSLQLRSWSKHVYCRFFKNNKSQKDTNTASEKGTALHTITEQI